MRKLSPGKRKLLDYLGEPYTIETIDREDCVYLYMGKYDIEISGGRTMHSKFYIYVWRQKVEIVERHMELKPDLPTIKAILDDIRSRYEAKN